MEFMNTRIGEHEIQMVCHSDLLTNWIRRSFPAEAPTKDEPDLLIHLTAGYGIPFVDYDVLIAQEAGTISYRRADYLIAAEGDYRQAKVSVHNELALKHALMNLYSSYVVYHQWGLLIHSSCAVDRGKAHMFAGHSGAGKSTAAKLSQPRELLSDEATVVKITPDRITVFNSPFRSELEITGAAESIPLAGIHILYQSVRNQKIPLNKSNGLLNLMDKIFYWSHSPGETGNVLRLLQSLVHTVPVYELHFQKNNTFWELIS